MLSIKPVGSSNQEVGYYAALGGDYYTSNETEPPGTWWGAGAEELGLTGTVNAETFRNILRGFSDDGKKLVQNAGDSKRRAAFDLTISVPKSVSTLFSQCNADQRAAIEQASRLALDKTLSAFDDLCGVARRGKLGQRVEKAGLVAAVFRHETSRGIPGHVPDPNLHFHVVLTNVVVRADGSTGAYDARSLFRRHMKMAIGAMFRTELSKELAKLGLDSYRPTRPNGNLASWFELCRVPKALVEEFSKRRQEIEKWLMVRGRSGAKAAEHAALKTRCNKEKYTRAELFSSWLETGRKHGITQTLVENLFGQPQQTNEQANAEAAVTRAINRLTQSQAHFSELEVLRFSAEEAQGKSVGIAQIRAAVEQTLRQSADIVRLDHIQGESTFTTREMLDLEAKMLQAVSALAAIERHQVSTQILSNVIAKRDTLRGEQAEAIRHITCESGAVACVNGMAGTGKTFALSVARDAWEAAGINVVGTALASTAAKELQTGSGIESTHIHRLLFDIKNEKRELTKETVLVVDEAGMVGTRQMEKLVALAVASGSKIVLVGDHKQLQAIDAGAPFRGIANRVGVAELNEIIRQREAWARTAVTELSRGEAESALQRYHDRGLLHIADDRDAAIARLADDWHQEFQRHQPNELLIFAGTNLEVSNINRLCQQKRIDAGEIHGESISVGRDDYFAGDRIVFTRNNAPLLVRNGSTGTIEALDVEQGSLRVRLDEGLTVVIDTNSFDNFRLAYGISGHRGQGRTVEHAFMLTGGMMTDREMSYVQGSRSRQQTRIYTDVISGGPDIASLAKQMNKSRAKDLAHDHLREAS